MNATSEAISSFLSARFSIDLPAVGGLIDGFARNCARYSGANFRSVRLGPKSFSSPSTSTPPCTWQVTHPRAANSRRPRSDSGTFAGAGAVASIAGIGTSVPRLRPQPLLIVIRHSPVVGTVILAPYAPFRFRVHVV